MRLFSEIVKSIGAELGTGIQYTVIGGGGYFQNVRKISEFSPQKIVLLGKKGALLIEGRELSIGKYYAGDVSVRGEIERVEKC